MDFSRIDLDDDGRSFAAHVGEQLDQIVTEDVHETERRTGDGFNESLHLELGSRGWVMPTWPVDQGGAGLTRRQARILELELACRQAPCILSRTTELVWSAVAEFGQQQLVSELAPEVACGNVRICLGYTEPDGGSDMAAANVRAERSGDKWVINGSKVYTTGAHLAQYVFLLTRSNVTVSKYRGLTMFLVPLDTLGIDIQPIFTYGTERTNVVYYDDVQIADMYRIGPVDGGWTVVHGPLDEEHSVGGSSDGLENTSIGTLFLRQLERALEATVEWAHANTRPDGLPLAHDPVVRNCIGRIAIALEVAYCTTGPMGRVAGSETLIKSISEIIDLVGPEALLAHGTEGAIAGGAIEYSYRWAQGTATYGGTVEIFRNLIAQQVLGLPKPVYTLKNTSPATG